MSPALPHLIEVKVNEIHQLFNSMDPSPFHERDLDHDAEQFIVSWAQEWHHREPLKLVIHLARQPEGIADPRALVPRVDGPVGQQERSGSCPPRPG